MLSHVTRSIRTKAWCVVVLSVIVVMVVEVSALNGPNVCMVKQKYNITKRVKYRAPMSVRTYEWCFSMPPRCSTWNTEMRDLTRLETDERTAEVAVCCPGYKMKDVSCVSVCPNGRTGPGCSEECPPNKWGPNCIHQCHRCKNGFCSSITGECECVDGWQGESCDVSMPPSTTSLEELLTTLTNKIPISNLTPKVTTASTLATSTKPTSVASSTFVTPTILGTDSTIDIPPKMSISTTPITATKTEDVSSPSITTLLTTSLSTTLQVSNSDKKYEVSIPSELPKFPMLTNTTISKSKPITEEVTRRIFIKPINNATEATTTTKSTRISLIAKNLQDLTIQHQRKNDINVTEAINTSIPSTISNESVFRTESTKNFSQTTPKAKPKEIWIRPAQKGESPIIETKIKMAHDVPRYRSAHKELISTSTTTKTIIVSIIPTSVSYSTFKKIALTSSYLSTKNTTNIPSYSKTDYGFTTRPMTAITVKPEITSRVLLKQELPLYNNETSKAFLSKTSTTQAPKSFSATKSLGSAKHTSQINRTNSMMIEINKNSSISVTTVSPKITSTKKKQNDSLLFSTAKKLKTSSTLQPLTESIQKDIRNQAFEVTNDTEVIDKSNTTNNLNTVTAEPLDDEEFHILTEPEHITAVMTDKGTERASVDLISVISIAGGIMMAVITVAVVIVMVERCKRPRYQDVRKINDITMQVMIDNNDGPPPYVRNIFHTPLPEPPSSEKCHYQPISTLDRNLKQFMRPVVVQTISPIMLENFRGILECHYDHLPRRSNDFGTMQTHSSIVPSIKDCNELCQLRASVTESAIEALKCEAKLDVIDNSTSEPLYAEIPCWRPPSEHAIEVLNMNGEAVTEL